LAKPGKNTYLPDRFDDVALADSRYVGTHRRERSTLSMFAPIGIGLGSVVVLVLAGLWFVDRSDDYLELDASELPVVQGEAPAEETAPEPVELDPEVADPNDPVLDPTQIDLTGLSLTILNGTDKQGMAARAAERLKTVGWPEPTATNADSTDVAESTVAYVDDSDRGIALGIAQLLGIDSDQVVQTSAYPGARVTVVLGANYVDTQST
jgi:hypothetical protein